MVHSVYSSPPFCTVRFVCPFCIMFRLIHSISFSICLVFVICPTTSSFLSLLLVPYTPPIPVKATLPYTHRNNSPTCHTDKNSCWLVYANGHGTSVRGRLITLQCPDGYVYRQTSDDHQRVGLWTCKCLRQCHKNTILL